MNLGPPRWLLFCEARADARTAQTLIDGLLVLHGAAWVRDQLVGDPSSVRTWWSERPANPDGWIDLHRHRALAVALGVKVKYGHFSGVPQRPGALMVDTLLRIARRLIQTSEPAERPSALLVLWDMDDEGEARREGVRQALDEGLPLPESVACIVGMPDPEREAWILAGYVPENDAETQRLDACRRSLGFSPVNEPDRLSAGRPEHKTNTKRVMEALGIDEAREARCLCVDTAPRRALLAERGQTTGLEVWLREVEDHLLPQVDGSAATRVARSRIAYE